MKRTSLLLSAAAFGAFAALSLGQPQALAQGAPQRIDLVKVDVTHLSTGYRASKINGSPVYNANNERIGTVDDLIVNDDDRVWYAILSVGGFLGVGRHLVAVPYDALQIQDQKLILPQASKDDLKALPEFKYAG